MPILDVFFHFLFVVASQGVRDDRPFIWTSSAA